MLWKVRGKIYSNCNKRPRWKCAKAKVVCRVWKHLPGITLQFKHSKYYRNQNFTEINWHFILITNTEFLACLRLHSGGRNCRLILEGNIHHYSLCKNLGKKTCSSQVIKWSRGSADSFALLTNQTPNRWKASKRKFLSKLSIVQCLNKFERHFVKSECKSQLSSRLFSKDDRRNLWHLFAAIQADNFLSRG